jgi:hypothetical protein
MVRPGWDGVGVVVNYEYIYIFPEPITVISREDVSLRAPGQKKCCEIA